MVKIRPRRSVRSPIGRIHLIAKQTTKRGFRTACGVYFTDTKKSKWEGSTGLPTCVNCRHTNLGRDQVKKKKR